MSFLLDTNVLSELRKGPQANTNVRAWDVRTDPGERFTSVIVIAELRKGALTKAARMPLAVQRSNDGSAASLRALKIGYCRLTQVAETWATLMVPNLRSPFNALIAATARVHALTLVSRNVRHFTSSGVAVLDPWTRL